MTKKRDRSDNEIWRYGVGYQMLQEQQKAEARRSEVLDLTRAQRPDLEPAAFDILADQGFPLTVPFQATPDDVLAYLEAFRPTDAPPVSGSHRRLRLEQAIERLRDMGIAAPTQQEIAEAIEPEITERTLRGWLTAEPSLRNLVPSRRRPRQR